jgi:hypothetical protein
MRYPISFDGWYRPLSTLVGLPPATSYVEIDDAQIEVRMGWGFRARFPRTAVASVPTYEGFVVSRGVHGFAGRWLVNGSGRGIVRIQLNPTQRAHVAGFPVRLRELLVSVDEPRALVTALTR